MTPNYGVMPVNNPNPGVNFVPEYQISAIPWVTSSSASGIIGLSFPQVTQYFTIRNTGTAGSLNVGFTGNGMNSPFNNYFTLAAGESFSASMRTTQLFLSGSAQPYQLIAGLTTIPASSFPLITGSNGFQGVG